MMLSVITPTHDTSFLGDTWESLRAQTNDAWEWVIALNGGATLPVHISSDPRVRTLRLGTIDGKIGEAKRAAALTSLGDVIVELDHDDLLAPTALQRVAEAFDDDAVNMVYSNSANFNDAGVSVPFNPYYNWRTRPVQVRGLHLVEHIAWPPSAHSFQWIWFAPDHIRAWRRTSYDAIGGHNPDLAVCDDHELSIRFYLAYGASGIKHIDECLYLYRLHDDQSYLKYNGDIQKGTTDLYNRYSRDLAIRWAKDSGLDLIDLGGRFGAWPGFTRVDMYQPADLIADLRGGWPLSDSSVGVLRASHIFEHLPDPIHAMNEAYRVLAPGGFLYLEVPSTDGRGAWQDPTHVSFWNENSITYYTDTVKAQYIRPRYAGRFQNVRTITYDPFDDHTVPVVQADLVALKPPYENRPVGGIRI